MENGNEEIKVRKGAWTKEEDLLLTKCIQDFGEGKWHLVPHRAGIFFYFFLTYKIYFIILMN